MPPQTTVYFLFNRAPGRANVSWNLARLEARQGDDVTVTCTATELTPIDAIRLFLRDGNAIFISFFFCLFLLIFFDEFEVERFRCQPHFRNF